MEWSPIAKPRGALRREPCLADYDEARRGFAWGQAGELLDGLPGGALNIAHEAVHRHAQGPAGDRLAIRFLAQGAPPFDLTYRELSRASHRFSNVLARLGVQRGERVATLMGRVPALYATVLGTLAAGAVYCPLFSAFGPEPVRARLQLGSVRVLVTTDLLYRRKVAVIRNELPGLEHVLVVRTPGAGDLPDGTQDFDEAMRAASPDFSVVRTVAGGLRAAALHQRHDGHAEGCAARACRGHGACRDGALGARPAARRRLLVHGRPGLGHRHLVRRHRAARVRRRHASSTARSSTRRAGTRSSTPSA